MGQSSSWNPHRRSLPSSSRVAEAEGLDSSIYLSIPCLKTGTKQRSGVTLKPNSIGEQILEAE